jgi:hypothetical protein
MNKSDSIKNLATALAMFQGEVKNPPKSADNPFFKSKYTTLDTLIDTAKPLLNKHGLSYIQSCGGDGSNISVTTLLLHNSGEWIESEPLVLKADKATAQGAGSAVTYARRYTLSAILGLASEEDDDGNGAEPNKKPSGNNTEQPKTLSDGQVSRLFAIASKKGYNPEAVKKTIMQKYNTSEIKSLSKVHYDEAVKGYEGLPDKAV